jgi:hypothetical protein
MLKYITQNNYARQVYKGFFIIHLTRQKLFTC